MAPYPSPRGGAAPPARRRVTARGSAAAAALALLALFLLPLARLDRGAARVRSAAAPAPPRCGARDPQVLVYNRISKAGSTTMLDLLLLLSLTNDFALVRPSSVYNETQVRDLAFAALSNATAPRLVIFEHFNFPDVHWRDRVAYVNIMREPLDRCVSLYYYSRYGPRPEEQMVDIVRRYGNETMDACVGRPPGGAKCLNCPTAAQVRQLCGGGKGGPCTDMGMGEMLEIAWRNVEDHYVIGLNEDLKATLELFEATFPSFFAGASAIYADAPRARVTAGTLALPSARTRAAIARNMTEEIELYGRVAAKFRAAHAVCVVGGNDAAAEPWAWRSWLPEVDIFRY